MENIELLDIVKTKVAKRGHEGKNYRVIEVKETAVKIIWINMNSGAKPFWIKKIDLELVRKVKKLVLPLSESMSKEGINRLRESWNRFASSSSFRDLALIRASELIDLRALYRFVKDKNVIIDGEKININFTPSPVPNEEKILMLEQSRTSLQRLLSASKSQAETVRFKKLIHNVEEEIKLRKLL